MKSKDLAPNPALHLQQAIALHQAGKLDDAAKSYRELLIRFPQNATALANLGAITLQKGNPQQAIILIEKSLRTNSAQPSAHSNRGVALEQLHRFSEALDSFDRAIALQPDYDEAHFNRGNVLHRLGRLSEALVSFEQAIMINRNHAAAHYNRANVLHTLNRLGEALAGYERTLALFPFFAGAHINRGNVLQALNRPLDALASYDKAIALDAGHGEAHYNRGYVLQGMDRLDEALVSYNRAIAIMPDHAEALYNRGLVLQKQAKHEAAIASYDRAISARPDYAEAYCNRGRAMRALKRTENALASFDKAIMLKPDYAEAHQRRGDVLLGLGQTEEALASFDCAIALKPDFAEALISISVIKLMNGEFHEGWKLQEWRWKLRPPLETSREEWIAGETKPERLLVWLEQGVGDHVFFGGLIPEIAQEVKETIVKIDARLVPIFSRSMPGIEFLPEDEQVPEDRYDKHISIGSLCGHLRNSMEDFRHSREKYLVADRVRTRLLHEELSSRGNLICGISWRSKNEKNGTERSMSLRALSKALAGENITLVNLQYGEVEDEIEALRKLDNIDVKQSNTVDNYNDLDGLASLVDACDLVVSIDNSTVHLSCALGKPTWIMLPAMADFRWLRNRTDSPWYPTARLFRQPTAGDWDSVLSVVADELKNIKPSVSSQA